MYYNSNDEQQFLKGELRGLRAARDSACYLNSLAKANWSRAEADVQRTELATDQSAMDRAHAAKERFRVSHREAVALKDEVAAAEYDLGLDGYGDEYGDLDEYGYAA